MFIDFENSRILYKALQTYKEEKDAAHTLTLPELAHIESLQTMIYLEGQRNKVEYSGSRCECGGKLVFAKCD